MADSVHLVDDLSAIAHPETVSPPLVRYYMTSDLRAATGISRTHLDFYLREGLVRPTARTESGYLLFDQAEMDRLRQVIGQRQAGRSLREIREHLGQTTREAGGPNE
jgi:DNA-binding transcriptional MerR regulator